MISFSLSSRHKISRFLLISIIAILILVIIADVSLSFLLNRRLNKMSLDLKASLGLDFNFSNVYFDFFYGALINRLSLSKDGNKILDLKSVKLNLDYLKIFLQRQLSYKMIYARNLHIYRTDYFKKSHLPLLFIFMKPEQDLNRSTMIKLDNMNFMDLVSLDLDGYFALAANKLLLTRGLIKIKQAVFLEETSASFINSLLDEPFNYAFEATFLDKDFVINKLDLAGHSARLLLSGKIKNFDSSINLELSGELKNLLLEDIQLFNNEYLHTNGILDSAIFVNGPLEDLNFKAEIKLINCNFNILNAFNIKKINSDLVWDRQGLRSRTISGLIDGAPVNLNLKIEKQGSFNKINLELSGQNLGLFEQARLNFTGSFHNSILEGDTDIMFGYKKAQKNSTASFIFKNLYLNLRDLSFKSNIVDMSLGESDNSTAEKILKELRATQLSGNLKVTQNSLSVDNIRTEMYNGTLKGGIIFGAKENTFSYNSKIYLDGLEIKEMGKEFLSTEYQLSGKLSGRIAINSEASENITGDIQIVNGKIENNAVLAAVSNFFGVPSLKTVDFSSFKILFRKIWDKYEAQINLFSKDVRIYLDNKFFPDGTMDGYLLVKLTTKLMDESRTFKRLFRYIGYKEPTVYFPFKLKGFVDKPRIEWLTNEFKEKLQGFLSQSNQKLLQREVNKLVDKFVQ